MKWRRNIRGIELNGRKFQQFIYCLNVYDIDQTKEIYILYI